MVEVSGERSRLHVTNVTCACICNYVLYIYIYIYIYVCLWVCFTDISRPTSVPGSWTITTVLMMHVTAKPVAMRRCEKHPDTEVARSQHCVEGLWGFRVYSRGLGVQGLGVSGLGVRGLG